MLNRLNERSRIPTDSLKVEQLDLVDYTAYYSCQNQSCNKRLSDVGTVPYQCCVKCGIYKRIEGCKKTIRIKIKMKENDQWLTVFEEVLKNFTVVEDPDELCCMLLGSKNLVITVDKSMRKVKDIAFCDNEV